ncbi:MAG: YoaK family protein [Nevskia sp.]|nr:YoaK family protein [Nevskia sp.]
MIRRLPPWVEIGTFSLALTAGAVNAIGLLGFAHQLVSHLTGSSTLLGLELANGDLPAAWHLLLVLLSFVGGAAISGLIVRDATLVIARRYSLCLLLEAGLLLAAWAALTQGSNIGHLLASAACGLQNAMASSFSGALVRTTHVTGLFTDLGLMLGRWLRGIPTEPRFATLYLLIIGGFICGGTLGALAYQSRGYQALAMPAAIAGLLALANLRLWQLHRAGPSRL